MKFSKCGIATSRKIALAFALVLIVAGGVYVALGPSLLGIAPNGPQSNSSSSTTGTASSNGEAGQPNSILDLFGNFSRMVVVTSFTQMEGGEPSGMGTSHLSYAVLGQTTVNSTNYYKVTFRDIDANRSVVAWFNQQGLVDRVDVLGDKNYTGPTAAIYTRIFVSAFSAIPTMSYNATLLAGLQRTAESVQSIGPTQMDITTYYLAAKTSTYNNFTIKIATVPGTNVKLAVYYHVQLPDDSDTLFQVTSVTRAP